MPYLNFTAINEEMLLTRDIWVIDQHNQTSWSLLPSDETKTNDEKEEEKDDELKVIVLYESSEMQGFELDLEVTDGQMLQRYYYE